MYAMDSNVKRLWYVFGSEKSNSVQKDKERVVDKMITTVNAGFMQDA